jgi:hypothetical protein
MLARIGKPNGAAFLNHSSGPIDNSSNTFDAPVHIFSKLVDPEANDLPTKASKLMISPDIIDLSHTARIAVVTVAVDLDVDLEVALTEPRQIQPAAGDRVLGRTFDPASLQSRVEAFFPWRLEYRTSPWISGFYLAGRDEAHDVGNS